MILGDHGFQRAEEPFILTEQGNVENNMPAFYLLPPKNLKTEQRDMYDNLVSNSHKLTSFYDLNQMLRDILSIGVNKTSEEIFKDYEGHGISLLADVSDRTCQEAEIPEGYCSCTDGVIKLIPSSVKHLAVAILTDTNQFVQSLGRCKILKLKEVKQAIPKVTDQNVSVQIQIEVKPQNALFEASFSFKLKGGMISSSKLTRLDWYSDTSHCVPDKFSVSQTILYLLI